MKKAAFMAVALLMAAASCVVLPDDATERGVADMVGQWYGEDSTYSFALEVRDYGWSYGEATRSHKQTREYVSYRLSNFRKDNKVVTATISGERPSDDPIEVSATLTSATETQLVFSDFFRLGSVTLVKREE